MSECVPYQSEKDVVYATGKAKYIEDDAVEVGHSRRITVISGTFEGLATTEFIELGYWNGHAYVPIWKDNPENASDYVHWTGNLWLREGQYVYAYCADVVNGEKIKLRVQGLEY